MNSDGYAKVPFSEGILELSTRAKAELSFALGLGSNCGDEDIHLGLASLLKKDTDTYTGLLKAFAGSPEVISFVSDPTILSMVRAVGLESPVLSTTPILHVTSRKALIDGALASKMMTPWHQDIVSTCGGPRQLVVWVPLVDVGSDNFPLVVQPGSHLGGLRESVDDGIFQSIAGYDLDTQAAQEVHLREGSALVFSSYLVHKTSPSGFFRLAVSFRFDDLADPGWMERKFFNPFTRVRDWAPKLNSFSAPAQFAEWGKS